MWHKQADSTIDKLCCCDDAEFSAGRSTVGRIAMLLLLHVILLLRIYTVHDKSRQIHPLLFATKGTSLSDYSRDHSVSAKQDWPVRVKYMSPADFEIME